MADFKPLNISTYDGINAQKSTPDSLYWTAFNFPTTVKEYGPVTHVDFPASHNDRFAISSSTSVKVYSTVTREPVKSFTKFREVAYGATFRRDGKLIAAGGEEGKVRLYDLETKSILRELTGHKSAVHRCRFTTDGLRVLSYGDDKSIVLWDVPGEAALQTFNEHKDYVRAGTVGVANGDIFLSGSYDHFVKMFDTRTKKSVLSVDHGAPVEDVLLFPSGGIFVSSGGEMMKVWDVCGGGKLLATVSNHHKTITCLSFASQHKRIMSGSLDKHVKVYDVTNYQVCHTLDFPSPILSLGISGNDDTLVVGMAGGLLSIQNRKINLDAEVGQKPTVTQKGKSTKPVKKKEANYDRHLRHFEVTKALDDVLRHNVNKNPEVSMAVIRELIRRGALRAAVAERQDKELDIMLVFILKHIDNPNFCRLMMDFTNIVLDVYGNTILQNERMINLMKRINTKLSRQLESMTEMMTINGMIDTLITTSKTDDIINKTQVVSIETNAIQL